MLMCFGFTVFGRAPGKVLRNLSCKKSSACPTNGCMQNEFESSSQTDTTQLKQNLLIETARRRRDKIFPINPTRNDFLIRPKNSEIMPPSTSALND